MRSHFPVLILHFLIFLILGISCKKNNANQCDKSKDFELVRASINDVIGWAKNKDFDLLYSVISNDSGYLEVDPGPGIIRGFEEFKKNEALWGSPYFRSVGYEISDLEITFSKKGNVAWYYCKLDDWNEWKGAPANWLNTRWTGVLEKQKDRWVIVQMHFSFASTTGQ